MDGIKWIFFDVGSTLMCETAAYEHRLREIASLTGEPYDKICSLSLGFWRQGLRGEAETSKLYGIECPAWHKEDEFPYPDAAETLKRLSERYSLGVIANQPLGTEARLRACGLTEYLKIIVASAEEGVRKPDRRIFELGLERCGCPAEMTLMVGDRTDNDIRPAKALGMRTCRIRQEFYAVQEPNGEEDTPDMTVDSLTELADILLAEKC